MLIKAQQLAMKMFLVQTIVQLWIKFILTDSLINVRVSFQWIFLVLIRDNEFKLIIFCHTNLSFANWYQRQLSEQLLFEEIYQKPMLSKQLYHLKSSHFVQSSTCQSKNQINSQLNVINQILFFHLAFINNLSFTIDE